MHKFKYKCLINAGNLSYLISFCGCCFSRKLLVKELRSLPHRVSLVLSGAGGVRGGGQKLGFFGYPPSGAGKKPRCQRGLFWARFRSFRVSGFLDVQRKNRRPLMLLMLAWACRLMLLMLVVSWPRCACFSSILALGVLQHVCLSMFGEKLVCWVKTCFSPVAVFVWPCDNVFICWNKTLVLTCYVGSKLLPPVLFSATFCLLQCGLAPAVSLPWQLQSDRI